MPQILVVEDDASIRGLVSEVLRDDGYEVSEASNGVEALEALGERLPDLIVLDLMMPIMDGWRFVEECRRNLREALQLMLETHRDEARLGLNGECILESIEVDVADEMPSPPAGLFVPDDAAAASDAHAQAMA